MKKIIAKRGSNSYLVLTNEEKELGRVWNAEDREWQGEEFNVNSILARGYWADFEGTFENGSIYPAMEIEE